MAGNLNSSDDEVLSNINVTPLVDVVLVLLIIFLITAPVIYQTSIKVKLAKASTGEQTGSSEPSSVINLVVTKTGDVFWDGRRTNPQILQQRLREMGDAASQKTAVISADRETPHGTVVELMDLLRAAGLTRLALNVEKTSATHPGTQ